MTKLMVTALACAAMGVSCVEVPEQEALRATIGPEGGELVGASGTAFEGVRLQVPAGALAAPTALSIVPSDHGTPLPVTAVRCGPMFSLQPAGLALRVPVSLTLPYDEAIIAEQFRFEDQVKVWVSQSDGWGQRLQTDGGTGRVTIELDSFAVVAAGVNPPREDERVRFDLRPNPAFVKCLARSPDDRNEQPAVEVTVVKGEQNDGLFLRGRNIRPGLEFDMFLVETSQLQANGTVDPTFKNFGLAFYVSDLVSSDRGRLRASIRAVLLNESFGFDPNAKLEPVPLHQVGFWFDDPAEAEDCGFDVTKPTPFNPKHEAGPMAMISLPDARTGLGPLCNQPDTSVSPAVCDVSED
jgi:hypothetical protein